MAFRASLFFVPFLIASSGALAQTAPMLRAHVEFLASDSMAGRSCPSRSCELTADYVLAQFGGAGLTTQIQTTEAMLEIRRGDVSVHPTGLTIDPNWLAYDLPAKPDADGALVTPTKMSIPKSSELDSIYSGTGAIRVTVVPAGMRNIIGVVRGRDPMLRDTYVLVTAHYDHIGERAGATGDRIYNGANDNASGVAGLIELARAIASSPIKPRRSIAFIAFFGEERGLVGSRYYAKHPVFPVEKTYAQVNLEQIGRTDDSEAPRVKAATVTGWDRSDVGAILAVAAKPLGIRIYKHEKFSEMFFGQSDNEALAKLGVPAHTVSVAYEFSDYHGLGDEAGKLDYANMALVTRALRRGIITLANRAGTLTLREPGATPPTPPVASPKKPRPAAK